jgi:hypothetical protein
MKIPGVGIRDIRENGRAISAGAYKGETEFPQKISDISGNMDISNASGQSNDLVGQLHGCNDI